MVLKNKTLDWTICLLEKNHIFGKNLRPIVTTLVEKVYLLELIDGVLQLYTDKHLPCCL